MAEAIVGLVLENLVPLLVHEATLLRGIHKEISDIKDELDSIQSLLKDADERAEREATADGVKTWVRQLREVAYHLEDLIDEYVYHVSSKRKHRKYRGLSDLFKRVLNCVAKVKPHSQIAAEIQEIKESIKEIKERGGTYGLIGSSEGKSRGVARRDTWHDPRVTSLFIEEAEVVGIESDREKIISWLVNGPRKRTVVSVVGMGGLGKTTLVRKVYMHEVVANRFHFKAWITVSQSYNEKEILRTTLLQFYRGRKESPPEEIETMDETMLMESLRKYLEQRSYVVVFDDVWHVNFWTFIRYALPDNNQGSRVLITTRNGNVAALCKESLSDQIYELHPLSEDMAFELFCNKVFHSEIEIGCLSDLEESSHNIVRRCKGLPLAIVTIGGMLSTKRKTASEWKKLECTLGSEMLTNPHLSPMTNVLFLSYYDLPYYLKLCFMYFGILPQEYSIKVSRLIRLWIAEGFVKGTKGKTTEQVADEYLVELIKRSLVQVSDADVDGRIRMVRVHDLMRDIILLKSEDWNFIQVWEDGHVSFDGTARRLSIITSADESVMKCNADNSRIRSISLFRVEQVSRSFISSLTSVLRLLKVLDLQDAPVDFLPDEVGILFHLRYLSVRSTKVKVIPRSIGKLTSLQTLDLKNSLVYELPLEIKNLYKLHYLLGYYYDKEAHYSMSSQRGIKFEDGGKCCLKHLQKLYLVEANHEPFLVKELRKLTRLRKLGINKLPQESGKLLCESIASMSQLESLEVCSTREDDMLDLQFISSPPKALRRLTLKGRLNKVPNWILELHGLDKLSLTWSRLMIDPLSVLHKLSNLSELELQQAYLGDQLTFSAAFGFQKLKILKLYDMEMLSTLMIEDKALPNLQLLKLGPLPRLKTVPLGIRYLSTLVTLRFYDMPKEFALRILPNVGPEFWIVKHVKTILFHYRFLGRRYKTYTPNDLNAQWLKS